MKLFTKTKRWFYATAIMLGLSAVGNAQTSYYTGFNTATKTGSNTSYNQGTLTTDGSVAWSSLGNNIGNLQQDSAIDALNIRFRTNSNLSSLNMTQDVTDGVGSISFSLRKYANSEVLSSSMFFVVKYSVDGGTSWVRADSVKMDTLVSLATDAESAYLNTYLNKTITINAPSATGKGRIGFETYGGSGTGNTGRVNLDEVTVTSYVLPTATCFPAQNVQVVDNLDGTLNLSWDPATSAPAVGYSYAVVPTGESLSLNPLNFSTSVVTSPTNNISTETNLSATPLAIGSTYDVYVISVCELPAPFGAGSVLDTVTVKQTITLQSPPCATAITVDTLNTDLAARTVDVTVTTTAGAYQLLFVDNGVVADSSNATQLTGLVLGNTYRLVARAICSAGDTSSVSDTLDFQFGVQCATTITVDTLNTNLTARTLDVAVTTTAPDYEVVLIDNATLTSTVITARPATLSGLTIGNNYTLLARAICSVGDTSTVGDTLSFQFGVQCATTITVDTLNTNLTARTVDVAVNTTAGAYQLLFINNGVVADSSNATQLTNLVLGNSYRLVARAICSAGDTSSVSDTLDFQFGTVCAPVTGLDTMNTDLSVGAIDISYTTTAPEVLVIIHNNTTNTRDSIIDSNPPYIQGLTIGNNYTVSVYAICGAGDTSATAATITFDFGTAPVPCDAVTNLVVEDNEDGSIDISWVAPATVPANGYVYAIVPNGSTPVAADYVASTTVSLTNLTATTTTPAVTFIDGGKYDVFVIALCAATDSSVASTGTVTVTIDNTPTACPDVVNLLATDNTDGSINISWDAVVPTPAEGYGYSVVPAGTTVTLSDFVPTTNTSVLNITETTEATPATLTKGATYDVYVITMCSLTPESVSNQVKTTVTITNISVEENAIALSVYPNPVVESVVVNANNLDLSNATIAVLDITGKVLSTTNMASSLTTLDMSNFAAGVYFVKVQSGVNMNIVKVVKK